MDIRKLDNNNLTEYDNLVDNSNGGTIFHKSWWLSAFEDCYNNSYNVDFYGAFGDSGNLISGLPVPTRRKFGIKHMFTPSLTPYVGPFYIPRIVDEKTSNEITRKKNINKEFAKILGRLSCIYYPFHYSNIDLQPFKWCDFDVGVKYTYILNLCDLDKVWKDMDRKRRNDISRCIKQGYNTRLGEIDKFIDLNRKTIERQNVEILSDKIWLKIFDICKKNNCCEIFTAYKDQIAVASVFIVWDNKRCYYLGSGIDNASEGAMSFVMWDAMKYTKEKLNLNEFDFTGSDTVGLEFFIRKFGGDIVPFFYISENSIKKVVINKFMNLCNSLNKKIETRSITDNIKKRT